VPNDIPDWTGQNRVNIRGDVSGVPLGDTGAAVQSKDSQTNQITTTAPVGQAAQCLASFKAAAGLSPAAVGVPGAVAAGSTTSVTPAFGQATVAGHLLVALVSSPAFAGSIINSVSAGWVKAVDLSTTGGSAIWYKPNCGNSEAAPTFTCGAGGGTPMFAQLLEFSGVATASPVDKTSTANPIGPSSSTATNASVDGTSGDLMASVTTWLLNSAATATFTDTYNNGAAAVQTGNTGATSRAQQTAFSYALIPAPTAILPFGVAPWPYDVMSVSAPATGTQATITLAANATKRYIAAALSGSVTSTTAVVSGAREFKLVDGSTAIFQRTLSTPAVAGQIAFCDLPGVAYAGSINSAMVLSLDTGVANISERVSLAAYLR